MFELDLEWLVEFYQVEKSKNATLSSYGRGVLLLFCLFHE